MAKAKKKVGIWIRVSTDDQAKGESPEHHEARARMYAQVKDWDVVTVYHLEGVSGKSVINHPEAQRMMDDVKAGRITGLIFSKLARLARSTKQLLEFADYFKEYGADLISLQEAIDTSSPAGRLFYTIVAAMAQWEREEISARVAASVPIRAKLGKSLGGIAPYGYKWVDQKLAIDETEAPIRKLMFELFIKHQKRQVVARILNEKGYRSRKGRPFTAWSMVRHLTDPVAKGLRRVNYTQSKGKGKSWEPKSEEDWVFQKTPAIVSEELWEAVNRIIREQSKGPKKPKRGVAHLFSGYATCECGQKMYVLTNTKKYICQKCRNKIVAEDLEEIFHEQLKAYIVSDEQVSRHLQKADGGIQEKQILLHTLKQKAQELNQQLTDLMDLMHKGELPKVGFSKHYNPLFEQLQQIEDEIPKVEGEIDSLVVSRSSSDQILQDAKDLYDKWPQLDFKEKRSIVETILNRIIVGKDDLEIDLAYLSPSLKLITNTTHNHAYYFLPPDQSLRRRWYIQSFLLLPL